MILLTMFTSFVISVATGIITVAMLQVAPETVTQTVNRVVEHTIERVVAGTSSPEKPQSIITNNVTKEVTVYAKEDDLVVSAVEKNQPRVAAIYASDTGSSSDPIAIGFIASRDGLIISDSEGLLGGAPAHATYYVTIKGVGYEAEPMTGQDGSKPLFFLKLKNLSATTSLDSVTYGRGDPKVAQTVVILGGGDGTGVFKATLSKMRYSKTDSTTTPSILYGIETLPRIADQNLGAPVVDLDGQLVGIVVPDSLDGSRSMIYPISRILESINSIPSQSSNNAVIGSGGG
jgi:hypothetical protein